MGRIGAGILSDHSRKSTLDSPQYHAKVNPDYIQALLRTAPTTSLLIWNSPNWPRFGDELGLALEGVFTGQQTDIQQALNNTAQDLAEVTSP